MKNRKIRLLLATPLAGFAILIVVLALGFDLGRHDIHPSSLLNKPFPEFDLQTLATNQSMTRENLVGTPRLINVWASWCVACRTEHNVLKTIANTKEVSLVGINYKDTPLAALGWLSELGNPFEFNIVDPLGDLGVDLGVYGAPESFLIDAEGVIQFKHVGPLTLENWKNDIQPLIRSWD